MGNHKKIIVLGLVAALTFSCLPVQGIIMSDVFAEEELTGEFIIDENGVLQRYNGAGGDVIIPENVTVIGDEAFRGCSGLKSVTIPAAVTSIGEGAFSGCGGLTNITIPEGVEHIGGGAFFYCSGLTSITIPEGITEIGNYMFSDCSSLKSVIIPDTVTSIEEGAFYDCYGLVSITLPEGVTSIGYGAFSGCSGLKGVTIPKSVTDIGSGAFSGCSGLTSVTIPERVTVIGDRAFYGCNGLMGGITIPEGVTSIGYGVFNGCSGLTSITVDKKNNVYDSREDCNAIIKTESNKLIEGCKNTVIPKGVKYIDRYAFDGCSGLTSITIPEGVEYIGDSAFSNCSGLASISIPGGLTSIGQYAFSGCSGLTGVIIPEGVEYIWDSAFKSCSGLTSITIPGSVTEVVGSAFSGCSGLISITVDKDNSVYDSREDCNAIIETESGKLIAGCQNTVIPEGVTSIGFSAFAGCSGLTSVTIPESVTRIGYGAFEDCGSLTIIKGKKGSYAESYAKENGYKFEDIEGGNDGDNNTVTFSFGGVTVTADISVIPEDASLKLGMLATSADADVYKAFKDIIANNEDVASKQLVVYTVKSADGSVTPNGKFNIAFAVPQGFDAANIVVIGEDGNVYQSVLSDDKTNVTIEAVKFGNYAVVEKHISNNNGGETGLSGDVDGNGKVNLNDAKLILKVAVGIDIGNQKFDESVADMDYNGQINLNDATMALRVAVGIK